jgi:hypothetical protein
VPLFLDVRLSILNSLGVLLIAAVPAAGQQRPLTTEDPQTVGAGHVLVEAGLDHARDLDLPVYGLTGHRSELPAIGVSIGLSSIAELQIDTGYSRLRVTERRDAPLADILTFTGDTTSSIDDVVIATKIRLIGEAARRPAFSIRLATKLPNAKNQTGLGTDEMDFFVSLLTAKTVRDIRIVGNVGVGIVGDPTQLAVQHDPLIYGVSVARAVTNRFEVVGELTGRYLSYDEPPPGSENRATLTGGLRYTYGPVRLDAGMGVGLTDIDSRIGFTSGVTWVVDAFRLP